VVFHPGNACAAILANGTFPWRAGGLLVMCFMGAFLTKTISILLLAGLVIILWPPLDLLRAHRRLLVGLATLALILAAGVVVMNVVNRVAVFPSRCGNSTSPTFSGNTTWKAFWGISSAPGRSLWLYSPVLLLSIAGVWQLIKEKNWRMVAAPAALMIVLSAAYGVAHLSSWWGSWGWGPRYMLPLMPVLMLCWMLPALPRLKPGWPRIGAGVLFVVGAGLQVLGMSVRLPITPDLNWLVLDLKAQPDWAPYNWEWYWSPIAYHLRRLT
jgi:hypothetical protein